MQCELEQNIGHDNRQKSPATVREQSSLVTRTDGQAKGTQRLLSVISLDLKTP